MNPFDVNTSASQMISVAVAVVVLVSVIFAVLYSLWGGFLLITSGGNEEKVKPAVNHIRHAFLWLIVLVLVLFVTPKILNLFGLPYGDILRPTTVFQEIRNVSAKIFGTSTNNTSLDTIDNTDSLDTLPSDFSDL